MLRYDLSTLAKRRVGTTVTLPPIRPTISSEVAYLRAERQVLKGMAGWAREQLIPAYEREVVRIFDGAIRDVEEWSWDAFEAYSSRLVEVAIGTVNRILRLEAARHTDKFMAAAKRALGVDLTAVVRENDLGNYIDLASSRSANLIQGLADDTRKRIKDRTLQAVLSGETSKSYRKTLVEDFGIADRRAQLIARDQIGKVTSDLNRIRHQQAGVEEYIWTTAHDERVRSLHRSLDGRQYKYGESTGAEGGLPPGQPIRCRCIARGVVEF